MKASFPAIYHDSHGQAAAEIAIDGRELHLKVRGIEFSGLDFDALEPNPGSAPTELAVFALQSGCLVSCEIELTMPILVAVGNARQHCPLHLRIEVPRTEPEVRTWAKAFLTLTIGDKTFRSAGHSGLFELEMLDIQHQLPEGAYLKACINCAYSDYSPAGQDMTGMMCFRLHKAAYLGVVGKFDMFRVTAETKPEYVQEFHLCPEFERRRPGTGYRG
jgi:uncharacterized protein DUF6304